MGRIWWSAKSLTSFYLYIYHDYWMLVTWRHVTFFKRLVVFFFTLSSFANMYPSHSVVLNRSGQMILTLVNTYYSGAETLDRLLIGFVSTLGWGSGGWWCAIVGISRFNWDSEPASDSVTRLSAKVVIVGIVFLHRSPALRVSLLSFRQIWTKRPSFITTSVSRLLDLSCCDLCYVTTRPRTMKSILMSKCILISI